MGKPLQAVDDYSRFTKFTDLGLSPVALHIGPFDLRWYSLAYLAGIFVGYWYLLKLLAQPGAPMARRHADDRASSAVMIDDDAAAGTGRCGKGLVVFSIEIASHRAPSSSLPLPFRTL